MTDTLGTGRSFAETSQSTFPAKESAMRLSRAARMSRPRRPSRKFLEGAYSVTSWGSSKNDRDALDRR